MPTLAQLQAEDEWWREIVTTELDWLGDSLCAALGISRSAFGTKGNESHLNGGHRSQDWIQGSQYCTNHSYTVQSNLSGEQIYHIAAGDLTPGSWGTSSNRALVADHTNKLWNAAVAGRLPGVTQVEGTLDGVTTAGLNVVSGSTFKPDISHLDHWHLTFDRRSMRNMGLMQTIYSTVVNSLGGEMYAKHGMGTNGAPISHDTMYLQRQMRFVVENDEVLKPRLTEHPLNVDGMYGDKTAYWASIIATSRGGTEVNGDEFAKLDQMVIDYKIKTSDLVGKPGPKGEQGIQGIKGDKGDAAVLAPGATLQVVN